MQEFSSQIHSDYDLSHYGLTNLNDIFWNIPTARLYEKILTRREGRLSHLGPLVVRTGHHTGWSNGPYGTGHRIPLASTWAMVNAALDGTLENVATRTEPFFGLHVPISCPGVAETILDPRQTWANGTDYDHQARNLADRFRQNFHKFSDQTSPAIQQAGPPAAL